MKTLYLDLFSGIAGDMFIGALMDLGVDPGRLERELGKLKLDGYHLRVSRGRKAGITGAGACQAPKPKGQKPGP
jgi:hypothetical protein